MSTVARGLHYSVAPRYTAGSPAMVSKELACRVAREERRAYERALEFSDHPNHGQAIEQGLAWIAWAQWEQGGFVFRNCWLTGRVRQWKPNGKRLYRVKDGVLRGALTQLVRESKRTGGLTLRLVEAHGAYKCGGEVHLNKYEVEETRV